MTGTFTPDESLSRDPERGAEAIERLDDCNRSATARIFAAGSVLRESPLSLEAVLVGYARRSNGVDVTIAPSVREEIEQLCETASEQGYAVDISRVLERTTPSTKAEALAAARRRVDASPGRRMARLAAFVLDARVAGIDISMDDLDGTPGMDDRSTKDRQQNRHALVERDDHEYVEPPVADRPTESVPAAVTESDGVYAGQEGGDASQLAVDGGEKKTAADESDGKSSSPDREAAARDVATGQEIAADRDTTEESERDPEPTVARTEVAGPVTYRRPRQFDHEDNTAAAKTETKSDREGDSAVLPTYEDPDTGVDKESGQESEGTVTASDSAGSAVGKADESTTEEESGFVWPAADDDIDPDVSPTVRTSGNEAEESREGPAALVTEDRSGGEIHEEVDLTTREETPIVRIVRQGRTDGRPPDPRTLTASLSAAETSVTDALESI